MDIDGRGSWGAPPFAGGAPEPACAASSLRVHRHASLQVQHAHAAQVDALQLHDVAPGDVSELASKALRVLLATECSLPHSGLRLAVLGSRADHGGSRSKCLLELAIASLVEQGLVARQGYGPLAALSVPDAALPRAEALAYSEFPDEGALPLYAASHRALLGPGGGGGGVHCPGSACGSLNRVRRHSSPRQFAHRPMAGVEKASGRRSSSKRSFGEEIGAQLHKKMRLEPGALGALDGGGGFGSGGFSSGGGFDGMSP